MILIRRATPEDAAAIAHVQVESWRTTYSGIVPDAYLQELDEAQRASRWLELLNADPDFFVAERDQQVVGFAVGGASRDKVECCDAELYAIYLLAESQRAKIGSDLLRELARALIARGFASMDVWVLARNPAKGFYTRLGAHYAATKQIEIGGASLMEQGYVWPDLQTLAGNHSLPRL